MFDPALLNHATFAPQLNSVFTLLRQNTERVELRLVEVSELKRSRRQERFSIVFRGPAGNSVPQGLYEFKHETIGSFALFIVPVGQDDQHVLYEAIFNRVRLDDESDNVRP